MAVLCLEMGRSRSHRVVPRSVGYGPSGILLDPSKASLHLRGFYASCRVYSTFHSWKAGDRMDRQPCAPSPNFLRGMRRSLGRPAPRCGASLALTCSHRLHLVNHLYLTPNIIPLTHHLIKASSRQPIFPRHQGGFLSLPESHVISFVSIDFRDR